LAIDSKDDKEIWDTSLINNTENTIEKELDQLEVYDQRELTESPLRKESDENEEGIKHKVT